MPMPVCQYANQISDIHNAYDEIYYKIKLSCSYDFKHFKTIYLFLFPPPPSFFPPDVCIVTSKGNYEYKMVRKSNLKQGNDVCTLLSTCQKIYIVLKIHNFCAYLPNPFFLKKY